MESSLGAPKQSLRRRGPPRLAVKKGREWLTKAAWRTTGVYCWVRFLTALFGGSQAITLAESGVASRIVTLLSSFGFAPVNAHYLMPVLKGGWVLLITGFTATQIIALAFYILAFPFFVIAFVLWLLLRNMLDVTLPAVTQVISPSPLGRAALPTTTLCGSLLIGWFLLYGDSTSRSQIIPGMVLSGVLFLLFVFRAFQRARPANEADAGVLRSVEDAADKTVKSSEQEDEKAKYEKKQDIVNKINSARLSRRAFRRMSILARGRRGRERISTLLLLEYVASLLLLGFTGALFWALATKLAAVPRALSIGDALQISVSFFLPGSNHDLAGGVPSWVRIGAGVSAWLLFVLYVGPAASLQVGRQQLLTRRIETTYRKLRRATLYLKQREAKLRGLAEGWSDGA